MARKKKISFDTVREFARTLPEVEESTMYGSPALKVGGKMFACLAAHKSAEPDSLIVCVGFPERDELIAAAPDTCYLKDHYVNYPVVLVRLNRVNPEMLRDLLVAAHRFVLAGAKRKPKRKRKPPAFLR